MAGPGPAPRPGGASGTSEESLLLGHLRQVRANPQGCYAVHVRLSELRPPNRQPHFLNIAARSFELLIANHLANLFPLSNSDFILVCRDTPVEEVDAVIKKVRTLFAEDPLTAVEHGDAEDRFSTWYDLSRTEDFRTFLSVVNDLAAAAEARAKQAPVATKERQGPAKSEGAPLAPKNLVSINQKLRATQIADLIRSQTALRVVPGGKAQIVFREHFVAIGELKARVAPDVNLFANPWLFQYLTETLDKRVLAVMSRRNFAALPDAISLNLNMNTILTRDFEQFRAAVGEHTAKVVIEMQLIDIFSDVNRFEGVRSSLQEQGFRVLMDGLNPIAVQFFDPSFLKPNFVKIAWGPEFEGEGRENRMREMRDIVGRVGRDHVVLSRVDSEDAVKWGLTIGITRFQGRFIDRLVEAMTAQGKT